MVKQEEVREGIMNIQLVGVIREGKLYLDLIDVINIFQNLHSQSVVVKVKCPYCEWSQFAGEESVGMTPCHFCDSTGYLVEPLIEEE